MRGRRPTRPPATIADVADHVDHVRDVAGIDHVGIGGDFDGAPHARGAVGRVGYPALFEELRRAATRDEDLAKIAGRNVLRVMRENERVAAG